VSQWAKRELGSWVAKTVKRLLFYLSFYNLLFFTYLLYILLIYYTIISLQHKMSIAQLLEAAEYLDRRERGM